ncbi:MAG: alpha/beta fold hydrolase [Defluviitaleaceae bacterium]|nr:alpha/beta fold hydrolase [Defluviitaleaceae bacterium]
MKIKRFVFLTATAAALTFALVGCGRNDDEEFPYDDIVIYDALYRASNHETPPTEMSPSSEAITIGDEWPIDAMLALPAGASASTPVPAVVIVAGSGSHDMDGNVNNILAVRPYQDIANFLQENGIGSIRHNRRFYQHPEAAAAANMTVYDEVMADALKALDVLLADPRVDNDRIYLLGHSMGGYLAPRIHALADQAFAGLIIMAGTPRSMGTLLIEQISNDIEFHRANTGPEDPLYELMLAQLAALEPMFEEFIALYAALADMPAEEAMETPIELMGGMSAYYLRDKLLNPFDEAVAGMDVDMFVMQPERDFQVRADTDFVLLQEILGGRDNVQFKLYPDLNHMFMPSTATNFTEHGQEIMTLTGHMSEEVLGDIANWIFNR